ncbi:MAG TPA: sugar phosphate nucleotidyltransferase, partial [Fimbriimonadaceae bacterium]|nr:sugar phosphate nucleotidyltransferase [Fimbriimonadaceae bacterium]
MLKAVILAAGKGTRLYPLTRRIAKPLLPLVNRITLLYAFDRLKELNIHDICIVVGENEANIREALGNGSQHGVSLSYVRQVDPHGLAHAVGFAKEFVGQDPFVLYLGDAIYDSSVANLAKMFGDSGCASLNLVKWVEDPRRYGVAVLEGDDIVKLVEKPQNPESNWAMAGMYFFGPELWKVLPDLKPSARGEYEITDAIQMLIDRGERVLAGKYEGTWFDTGTLDSFLETSHFLAKGRNVIAGQVTGAVGENVIVGEGAVVECAAIEDTVVLPCARVTGNARIRHCVIAGDVALTGEV